MMVNWYAIHVLTGKELEVKTQLLEDEKNDLKVLVPRRKLQERKRGQWQFVERTLFPGYVFVRTVMNEEAYYNFIEIPGVIKILKGASERPMHINEDEMKIVYRLTKDSDLVGISDIFCEGQNIKVISGPLQGYEGNILKIDRRRFRAKVYFILAGRKTTVELGVNVLDKV
jgi:transcriptional antiterminator NusG